MSRAVGVALAMIAGALGCDAQLDLGTNLDAGRMDAGDAAPDVGLGPFVDSGAGPAEDSGFGPMRDSGSGRDRDAAPFMDAGGP